MDSERGLLVLYYAIWVEQYRVVGVALPVPLLNRSQLFALDIVKLREYVRVLQSLLNSY